MKLLRYPIGGGPLRVGLLLILLLLTGCGLPGPGPAPGPALEPSSVSPQTAPLLAGARQALERRDLAGAEGYLERAIRLEPRNPLLWHTLAQTKYRQGQYAQTVQLGLRSNALLPQTDPLARENLRLMAEAHRQLGQEESARQLEEQLR
ncbi:MAG: tetratricopeptide repeat protein [Desulfurivibrio sp.]